MSRASHLYCLELAVFACFATIGQSFDWREPIGLQERLKGRSSHNGEISVMSRDSSIRELHGFVAYSVTHRMRPSPPKIKRKLVYLNFGAFSRGLWRTLWRTCHVMGAELSDRLFGQNTLFFFFFYIFNICVCVFCGECCCICMISICVADSKYKAIFIFISQIILIVFFSGQINNLYDVEDSVILKLKNIQWYVYWLK